MRKTFIFLLVGVFAVVLWTVIMNVYIDKVANDDFKTFLDDNMLQGNVVFKTMKRSFLGKYAVGGLKIVNLPNRGFSFSADSLEIENTDNTSDKKTFLLKLKAVDFNIYSYLLTKTQNGEFWWRKARGFDVEDAFFSDTAYFLSSLGIDRFIADIDIYVSYNKSTGSSYMRLHADAKGIADIIFSAMIDTVPQNLFRYMVNFIKNPDEKTLPAGLAIESVQLILADKGFAEKLYKNIVLYSYEDDGADGSEKISFAKTNVLSDRFMEAGYGRERADENARNIADFYNRKTKISVISGLNEKIDYEKIKNIDNIFKLMHALNADAFALSDGGGKIIQIEKSE